MNFQAGSLPGCMLVSAPVVHDERGFFTKPFSHDSYRSGQVAFDLKELYWSWSRPRTLRGMHFQTPPYEQWKLVWCAHGEIIDVVLDLRIGSPTFKATEEFRLTGESGLAVVIPPGVAHGFYVPSEDSIVVYGASSVYSPEHDKGVLWCSIGFEWPDSNPVISVRDKGFPTLHEFASPFSFGTSAHTGIGLPVNAGEP